MNFNPHYELRGKHAPLSPSSHFWLRYDKEKMITVYKNLKAKELGTIKHDIAAKLIQYKINLPRSKKTYNSYVNDSIGFGLKPEQPLFYSYKCFGTADAISEIEDVKKHGYLRIHDLKTGKNQASMDQLRIYAALFFLEYEIMGFAPETIKTELRIYQNDEITIDIPEAVDLRDIMDKIVWASSLLEDIDSGVL